MAKPYQRYHAHAFHPDNGPEPIQGEIFFTTRALSFRGAEKVIEIPIDRLEAEYDGAGEGRVILRDGAQPDLTLTSDASVLEVRSVPVIAALAQQLEAQLTRREFARRGKMVLIFFVGFALVLWVGMLLLGAMVRSIVARVPPEVEKELGNEVLEELRAEHEFVNDTNLLASLTETAQPLLRALPPGPDWQFHVVKDDSLNAFALPGGHITVTTGLLRGVERPEELLGVLAHELAHVTLKHGFRQQVASAGPFLVLQVFMRGRSGTMAVVAGGSALLVHQSFSQEYEKEADDKGWDYLVAANIDPRGMISVFHKLKAEPDELSAALPKAFHSHPDLDKRIARLETKWKRLPRKSGFVELDSKLPPLP